MPSSKITQVKSRSILGVLLPRLLLIAILMDLGLRWVPKSWLTPVRSPVARVYTPADALSGSMVPGIVFRGQSSGDLARLGNLRKPRIYREQRVETDALGYMNPPYLLDSRKIDVLMVGDSFLTATSDGREKTLPGQLEQITGLTVYNAGRPNLIRLQQDLFFNLVSRLHMDHGVVVFELHEVARNVPIDPPPPEG